MVRRPEGASELSALGVVLKQGDILDKASMVAAFAGCDGVFHLAASYEFGVVGKRADEALRKNLDGTRLALEAAWEAGAKRIVYTSTILVHGNTGGAVVPESHKPANFSFPGLFPSHYAMSKARAHYEIALPMIAKGAPIIIVMPGGVIGPRDHSSYRLFWYLLARGLPVMCGSSIIATIDVQDCAAGHALVMEKGVIGESYHLLTENLSLPALIERAAAAAGIPGRKLVCPSWFLSVNAAMMGLVERVIPLPDVLSSDALRSMNGIFFTADGSKARALGFAPRAIEESLREILADEFLRANRPLTPLLAPYSNTHQ
jgi:nucleoside-diphosphate-sugar epimerase